MRDDLDIPPPGYRIARQPASVDPATRRLAMIAAGIGGALVVLVGVWSMVGSGGAGGIPVVASPPGPMRVKPAHPGGMQVRGTTDRILGGGAPTDTSAALAPPPETPNLQALKTPPAVVPAAPSPSSPTASQATAALAPTNAPTNGLPLPPPAPPPLQVAATSIPAPPPSQGATASVPAPPPAGAGTGSGTEVQLAAMNSEQGAMREWHRLQSSLPTLFDTLQPTVSKVVVDGHTFWRLRTGGFPDIAAATHFCAAVRAKGNGCAIATF